MRYRIEHPVPGSPLSSKIRLICNSDRTKLGQIFINKPETERLRAYIEAHDEVTDVLREALTIVMSTEPKRHRWASDDSYEQIGSKIQTLIARIEGKERQI